MGKKAWKAFAIELTSTIIQVLSEHGGKYSIDASSIYTGVERNN